MEVIRPMAKKIKLSDAAKDINIPAQELIDSSRKRVTIRRKQVLHSPRRR